MVVQIEASHGLIVVLVKISNSRAHGSISYIHCAYTLDWFCHWYMDTTIRYGISSTDISLYFCFYWPTPFLGCWRWCCLCAQVTAWSKDNLNQGYHQNANKSFWLLEVFSPSLSHVWNHVVSFCWTFISPLTAREVQLKIFYDNGINFSTWLDISCAHFYFIDQKYEKLLKISLF